MFQDNWRSLNDAEDIRNLVIEVLNNRGSEKEPDWLSGSGSFVGKNLVLTAFHNVQGASELFVRSILHGPDKFPAKVLLQGNKDIDLALLEVSNLEVDAPPHHYGEVDQSVRALVDRCWAIGFPQFMERTDENGLWRDSAQVDGKIPTGDHLKSASLKQPLLTLRVQSSPRSLPSGPVPKSEWAGISGATVLSGDDIIVGVITEHHLPEGESALTVVPITAIDLLPEAEATKWWESLGVDRQAFVRVPGDVHIDHPTTYLPFFHNTLFQSRPGEFEHLETLLLLSDPAQRLGRVRLVGITGMGGIGKTQLAVEFAYRYQDRFPAGIFWMLGTGHTYADWLRQFAKLAENTDYLPANDDISHPENEMRRARHFCRYLAGHADALLILDNVEDPSLLKSVLPALAGGEIACSLLYTSRVTHVSAGFVPYQVKKLPQEAALRLLLAATRSALLTEILQGSRGEEAQAAQAICNMVDNLPLALVHLRSLLDIDRDMLLTALLAALRAQGALEIANDVDPDAVSLIATFRLSWERVKEAEAQRLFKLAAYFPETAPIPLWLLGLAAGLGERTDGFTPLGKMWTRLQQLSLLEKLSKEQVSLHPVVREFGQHLVVEDGPEGKVFLEEACERLVAAFTNLNALEQRANQQGYWGCLEQVRAAHEYAELLVANNAERLSRIAQWLDHESYLLGNEQLWPQKFPQLFYQQLYNRAVEEGDLPTVRETPIRWLRQVGQVKAEDRSLLRVFTGGISSVAFSRDGSQVLTGSLDGTARLWEAASGKLLATLRHSNTGVRSVAFSPDGSQVLTGLRDGTAQLWEVASNQELITFVGHQNEISSVAFSPDGSQVLTGSLDGTARLWEVASGQELIRLEGHKDYVESVAFSPDGSQVLTGSWDHTARLWEVASGKVLITFSIPGYVEGVAFSPDGSRVLTGSRDGTARLWEVASGQELITFVGHQNAIETAISSVAFSPNGSQVLTGSRDGTAQLWEVTSGQELITFVGHKGEIESMAFSPDGTQVLTGSGDGTARLWEVASGMKLVRSECHTGYVTSLAFSPDGSQVLTGSHDGTARLWEVTSGKELARLEGHTESIMGVAFSLDGTQVLTGSGDGTARLWEVATGKELVAFVGHDKYVEGVAFSPDGTRILTGSGDRTARLWEVATGREVYVFGETSMIFFPDGTDQIIKAGHKTANGQERTIGRQLACLSGHSEGIETVAFSPDGSKVLTGSYDGTARLWEAATGKELAQLNAGRVTNLSFSPDGNLIMTCHFDGRVLFWLANEPHPLGIYFTSYTVEAIHWQDSYHVILADKGGLHFRPHLYQLKLEGKWY